MLDWVWAERYWFPDNLTVCVYKDLENQPDSNIYYPQMWDLHWSLVLGLALLGVRYLISRFVFVPLGYCLGVAKKKKYALTALPALERAYQQNTPLSVDNLEKFCKTTDLSQRQIQSWLRKRKQNDATPPIKKFCECGWHFLFYSLASIGGFVVLWDTPWFSDTAHLWLEWPFHSVSRSLFWYYMLEASFYWGLLISLCYEHRRKDFQQMVGHYMVALLLIYFSWMTNQVRSGSLVLLAHDVADPFLALGKMLMKTKIGSNTTAALFVMFIMTWAISRLYFYPAVIIYSATTGPYTHNLVKERAHFSHYFINGMLYMLMFLNVMWTYSIAGVVVTMLKDEIKDVRSDSEGSDKEDNNKLDAKTERTFIKF